VSRALWETVLEALDDIDALLTASIPAGTLLGKGLGIAALRSLRAGIRGRLDELNGLLTVMYDEATAGRMILPLVLYLDERVMALLPLSDKLAWELLQDDVLPSEIGGEEFYARIEALLQPPASDAALQIYYYCLDDGFHGRFDDKDVSSIEDYKRRLRAAISPEETTPATEQEPPPEDDGTAGNSAGSSPRALPRRPIPAAAVIAGTAVLAVLMYVVPTLLSNL
jgi:type IV/VI secretion system ImpK/VasF family protein